ncbi:NAD(P)H-binding protein [Limosilactobacillus reuteri]|uniref:NAD(P)H-binding protein n=1 Tax=Limosilactobacillus reuteri TaxID=1598 RepID=UPI002B053992|nr:NAD(P)H-binding protein [Limosilactobacillus reuteri]
MGRIIFISHRHDDLVPTIIKKVPEAVALTSFKLEIQRGDVLCWLPTVNEYVDDEVQELAELIDHSLFLPSKIVMLSIAGTADDATNQQLQEWYGQQATQAVLAHQYAVKMIDEFELPYTIIRALPITNEETSLKVVSEGRALEGKEIGLGQIAQIIEQAVTTDDFRNQSIGIAP